MSGSAEVRHFLLRQEGGGQLGGPGGVPAQRARPAETPRVSDDQVRRARLVVARGAHGPEDCAELLDMLGLTAGDDGQTPVQR